MIDRTGIARVSLVTLLVTVAGCNTGSKPDGNQPRVAVQTECAQLVIACYDGFARQPANLACFRPTSRWPTTHLTWRIANPLATLDADTQRNIAADAFALWAEASALTFERAADGTAADITIHFDSGEENGAFPFDGPGGHLGLAYFPGSPRPGDIYLSDIEAWQLPPSEAEFVLAVVLLHEIGHALGLEHSLDPNAVMGPAYHGPVAELTEDDVAAIRKLYGSADGEIEPLPQLPTRACDLPASLIALGDPDTDGDGIPDTIEVLVLGTDPLSTDTDADALSDFDEVFRLGTPPNVRGPDRDGDDLPDDEEARLGTNPGLRDTDEDGVNDGIEVHVLGTDPLSPDTDGDGFNDGNDPWPTRPDLPVDCNENGIADDEEPQSDCNDNGAADFCDIAAGTSEDCQPNGMPDECEADCNGNGVPDECDLAGGDGVDCNANGLLDECDLEAGLSEDCNGNGVPDACDLTSGLYADCNENGVLDDCDLEAGGSKDCDSNGVPDECDADCNTNGVPDACEDLADCNTNGQPDICDLAEGASPDCNANGVPDECDLVGEDCNGNGLVDSCEIAAGISPDCNGNAVPDACDIAEGISLDLDRNGIPDECDGFGGTIP